MALHLVAILPRRYHSYKLAQESLDGLLKTFQVEAASELQAYPPWRPWKYPPPRTGPRAGGRRTGMLGRNWSTYRLISGKSITMENKTSYGRYVQGNRNQQAKALAARGWKRVDAVGAAAALRAIAKWKLEA